MPEAWEELLQKTHLTITPEAARLAEKYHVPVEVVATAKGDPERIARAVALAEHRELWKLTARLRDEAELLGIPSGLDASRDGAVLVIFPSGARVAVPVEALPSDDPQDIIEYFGDYVLITARRDGKAWRATRVKRVIARDDTEAAEELMKALEADGYEPAGYHAALIALNYRPDVPPCLLPGLLARILPAVNHRVHSVYLSVPGTGKTHTAMVYRHALGWAYYPKPPTPATLVGDARSGRLTGVRYAGMWLDEIDKWSKAENREKLAQAIEILLTGMENCEWVREAGGEKAIRVTKCIPFVFTGNVGAFAATVDARTLVYEMVESIGEGAARAFESRIAVAVAEPLPFATRIVKHAITGMVPRRSFVRGVFRVLRERLLEQGGPLMTGPRMDRHRENVRRALLALGFTEDQAETLTGILVEGFTLRKEHTEKCEDGGGGS